MSLLPPTFGPAEFAAIDSPDGDEIKRRFTGHVRSLHTYLNQLLCVDDLQKACRRWRARVAGPDAFGTFASESRHWYSFHHGGRNEAQFNIGMFKDHLRIGLGFEFSQKKGGDSTVVQLVYSCFLNVLRNDLRAFESFVVNNYLEAEYLPAGGETIQIIRTAGVLPLLLNLPREPLWLFVGRLLRPGNDSSVLEDGSALGNVMESVLGGFRPVWEQTQMTAKA